VQGSGALRRKTRITQGGAALNRLTQLRPYAAACIVWALQALGAAALAQTITPSYSDTSSVTGSLIPAAQARPANAFRALGERIIDARLAELE